VFSQRGRRTGETHEPLTPTDHPEPGPPHDGSNVTLAAVMAGIAALFLAGIAAAFIYAKDTNSVQHAQAPLPPPASYDKAPAETTGSGGVR
jgi:hypothetical protein